MTEPDDDNGTHGADQPEETPSVSLSQDEGVLDVPSSDDGAPEGTFAARAARLTLVLDDSPDDSEKATDEESDVEPVEAESESSDSADSSVDSDEESSDEAESSETAADSDDEAESSDEAESTEPAVDSDDETESTDESEPTETAVDSDDESSDEPAESIEDGPLAGDDTEARPGLEKAPPFVLGLGPLKSALESLIFVSDKPLTDRQLADLAHASVQEVRMAAFELQKEYEGRGIELHQVAGGYQFRSSAKNAPFVRVLVAPKPVRLSRALLETLSIVAYRQPVTRPEIDDVRGVDSGEALKGLADRDLIRILGRKEEPGRPLLYGTTKHFLEFFGLNSLRDLPTLREYAELTDESRSIFERRMGEPLDLKGVQAQADAAIAEQHAKMLDSDSDDETDSDDSDGEPAAEGADTGAEAGELGADADPDAPPTPPTNDESEADEDAGEERPAEDEE